MTKKEFMDGVFAYKNGEIPIEKIDTYLAGNTLIMETILDKTIEAHELLAKSEVSMDEYSEMSSLFVALRVKLIDARLRIKKQDAETAVATPPPA